jgi:hypothetical protein
MRSRQATLFLFLLALGPALVSACSQLSHPLAINDVPVYTGAQPVDPSQNATTAAVARQDK